MAKRPRPARDRRDDVLDLLASLALKIEVAKTHADRAKSALCLVELESASMIVDRLKADISKTRAFKRVNWNSVVDAIAFIGKLVDRFNAFLNCKFRSDVIYEDWLAHKTVAYHRWYFADRLGVGLRGCAYLLIASGKQQGATWYGVAESGVSKVRRSCVALAN